VVMLFKFISRLLGCLICSLSILSSSAFALQQADFSWLPNGEPNLAGYKIYYSTVSAQYDKSVDVGNPEVINGVVQAPVNGLEDGTTYYFAATAYDSDGFESDYSQEVVWASPVGEPVSPPSPLVANDLSLSIAEDITGTGQLNGQSSNSLPLTYQIVTNGSKGTASITDSGAGTFSYTPQANINGVDTFSYTVSDANGESGVATVTITITPVNDAPTADEQLDFTNEDQVLRGSLTAHDVEGDSLTYTIGRNASNGLVIISADGSYSYTPDADFNGSDSFTFQANDGSVYSNSAIVNISINPVNDVPVAYDDSVNVQENQTATGILQGNDIDSGQLTYSIISNGILGTATIVDPATGIYTYTPNGGAHGEDSFRFIVSDGSGESNQATVHVTIQQTALSFAMEIGQLTVDGTWFYVSFTETFQDPVVVAKPA
ncbi:MAG: tandem-95 repeat protein, partial [Desulfobulbaceae bacterium]|nr:tandem-95 repeat protein [Desulfobulbaceae bacterium]